MKPYLFLWNPKKDTDSFNNYLLIQREAVAGRPHHTPWICPSRQPQVGDIAIFQRTGNQHNGIFARGIIVKGPYPDEDGTRKVDVELTQFLPIGKEIARQEIVENAEYKSLWMPMASGNLIPEPLYNAIEELWQRRTVKYDDNMTEWSAQLLGGGFGSPDQNHEVEVAAVRCASNHYGGLGYVVETVESDKCGYDLVATCGGVELHIEVKGISGNRAEFLITKNEVTKANEDPLFQLAVVTDALNPNAKLHVMSGEEFLSQYDIQPLQFMARLKR